MIEVSDALRQALASRPVLAQGQADDLVIESGGLRIWLSRVDGTVSVEYQGFDGVWREFDGPEARVALRLALLATMGKEWEEGIW